MLTSPPPSGAWTPPIIAQVSDRIIGAVARGLGGRSAARKRIKERAHVRWAVADEPPKANERDAGARNAVLLQRALGAFDNFRYLAISK
jgi:hypothetical protein